MLSTLAPPRVLVLEPNHQLRAAILSVLEAERYMVETCESLEQVIARNASDTPTVALIAWQTMQGLLAEDRRDILGELTRELRLVVMVPRRWASLLESTDLGHIVAGLVAKPFGADELLDKLNLALADASGVRAG